jgi:leucine-rich repeat-containing G protein-coupled receptor 7
VLDLSRNPISIKDFSVGVFDLVPNLKRLYVVHEESCCTMQHVDCQAELKNNDVIGSCQNILAYSFLIGWVYLCMILTFLANIASLVWWLFSSRYEINTKSILSCNLNVADCLMAVYLGVVAVADVHYRNNVGYVALQWKYSSLCQAAGGILLLSVEASTLSTLLIALDRFVLIVLRPFEKRGLHLKTAISGTISCWVLAVALPVVLLNIYQGPIKNSACIFTSSSLPPSYAISLLVINTILFLFLLVVYILILHSTLITLKESLSKRKISPKMLLRLGIIIFSNFIAGFTISMLSMMSLFGLSLFPSQEATFGLILFPINAFINPLIYTIATKPFHDTLCTWNKKKIH